MSKQITLTEAQAKVVQQSLDAAIPATQAWLAAQSTEDAPSE